MKVIENPDKELVAEIRREKDSRHKMYVPGVQRGNKGK